MYEEKMNKVESKKGDKSVPVESEKEYKNMESKKKDLKSKYM